MLPEATVDSQFSSIAIQDLVSGCVIPSPLYDENHTLLLAEGSVITKEYKQALLKRGIKVVLANHSAVSSLTQTIQESEIAQNAISENNQIAQKIDQMIDSGLLKTDNDGEPFRVENVC